MCQQSWECGRASSRKRLVSESFFFVAGTTLVSLMCVRLCRILCFCSLMHIYNYIYCPSNMLFSEKEKKRKRNLIVITSALIPCVFFSPLKVLMLGWPGRLVGIMKDCTQFSSCYCQTNSSGIVQVYCHRPIVNWARRVFIYLFIFVFALFFF